MQLNNKNNTKRILLTGGGTGGSVAPLLAVAEELKNPPNPLYQGGENKIPPTPFIKGGDNPPAPPYKRGEFEFLWLGTKFGPERAMVERAGIKFKAIVGGKWRRYFSLKNLVDIFKIKLGFWQAFFIMLNWRPNLVISAGSFVSVPVIWAAWMLRVPILIHQQDIQAGLANKLMAPLAKVITVTFEKSLDDYGRKAVWTGNPVRKLQITNYKLQIKTQKGLPIVLIVGGGTGAEAINKLVEESFNELIKFCQVIHVMGKGKGIRNQESGIRNYVSYEFLDAAQMAEAMKLADLVVTRAGLATLSELSSLGKPSIIIPMPESHQEANAAFFKSQKAAVVVRQKDLTAEIFIRLIKNLLADEKLRGRLAMKMNKSMKRGANEAMAKIINKLIK